MMQATMGMSFIARLMELFSCPARQQVPSRITRPLGLI